MKAGPVGTATTRRTRSPQANYKLASRVDDRDKPNAEDDAQGSGGIPPAADPGKHGKDEDED
jgi:hypothetical protein